MSAHRDRKTETCPKCGGKMYAYATLCRNCRSQSGKDNGNWKGGISNNNYAYKLIQKERYPERIIARQIVSDAIRAGRIVRGKCFVCGSENAQAHHDDYYKPLDVRWLCRKHHRHIHDTHI